jgi:branched-chain amino acid transport system substrate-binding protein
MKKFMVAVVCVCVTMAIMAGAGTVYAQQKLTPYPVGVALELTGIISNIGQAEKKGLDIAVDAINAAGGVNGRQLKLFLYDTETNPAKGVTISKRLIDVDKVVASVGYGSSGVTMACIQTYEENKVLMISGGASEKIWIPTRKWIFTVVPRQKEASIPILLENLIQRGAKKIAYIHIDNVYGQTGREVFDATCKEMNIKPAAVEKYAPASTDVGPQIVHIKAAGADGLLVTGQMADTVMVIKNARDQGFAGPIVSDYAIVGPEFIELAGKNAEGIVTTSLKALVAPDLAANDPQRKVAMDLYSRYTKQYGAFSLYAGHTWDQIYLLAAALKQVDPKLDPAKPADLVKIREQVRDALEKNTKGFVGQNGIFNLTPENHNGLGPKCYVPVVVEKGKWRLYKGK